MGRKLKIPDLASDAVIDLALDTINKGKQALVFVNTRNSAEAQAEKIAAKRNIDKEKELGELSEKILKVLQKPTKQCRRLARCVAKGTAFHHSGLHSKQRDLIEDNFKGGLLKIICSTPTLAAGVDMPAFRVIIRDLKRFSGGWGMISIPVLEYEQQAGRAGRPSYDNHGEAIAVAKNKPESEEIFETYVKGEPEEIYSKLAVEPVLRIYALSLVAAEFVSSKEEIYGFFEKTFYAHQFKEHRKGGLGELHSKIDSVLQQLEEWEFLISKNGPNNGFTSASELSEDNSYKATNMGRRISELYLDPLTANRVINALRKATSKEVLFNEFSLLHMVSNCNELRPRLRVRVSEYDKIQEASLKYMDSFLIQEPSEFDDEYDEFLASIKTALFFNEWIEEKDDDFLMEVYNIRPGEVRAKLEIADWLLYASEEISRILNFKPLLREIKKLRARLKYGAREELLPLLKIRGVGRVRGRALYEKGIKDVGDVKKADVTTLAQLLGKKTAIKVKKQVGEEVDPEKIKISEKKRKGQMSLKKFD